jgi:hypothetical protein
MIATFVEVLFGKKIFCKITAGTGYRGMTLVSGAFDLCQSLNRQLAQKPFRQT